MKISNPYLAWVRNRYDHDFFYLEAGDYYYVWTADYFGKSAGERWAKFLADVMSENELPEPSFRAGSALHIYLHNPTYDFVTFPPCEIYINGIFPKLKEVSDK